MTAPDKIWAWDDFDGNIPRAGDWCDEKSECPEGATEYTRTASIHSAAYVAQLEAALQIAGPIALQDYRSHPFILLNAEIECVSIIENAMASLSSVTRAATLAQDLPEVKALVEALREIRDNPCMEPEGNSAIASAVLADLGVQ